MNNSRGWKNLARWEMHNRKNIVLMFLIIMLSFANTIEVSAETNDDADVGESGLNDLTGLFNPKDHKCRAKDLDISSGYEK